MSFPFSQLPIELGLDIFQIAASPARQSDQSSPHQVYATARALAAVSHHVRQVTMPHLLYTVILNSHKSLNKFIQTLQQQKELASMGSRLQLDYSSLVRHFWCSRCWEPMLQESAISNYGYDLLGEVFHRTETLGFTFISHHLLYGILGGQYGPDARDWSCKRLTLAGKNPRWNPLISTTPGQAFLRQLTHLTMWLPTEGTSRSSQTHQLDLRLRVPNWIQRVPFEFMPSLTDFAFTLMSEPSMTTTSIVVYTIPPHLRQQQSSIIFRTWAKSADPISYGRIVHMNVGVTHSPDVDDANWGIAFLRDSIL